VVDRVPLIELRGIRKRYGGGDQPEVEVLHGVDLTIHAGEFVAIVGTSGSGKSTMMNILGCLDRPTEGTYKFNGQDVSTLSSDALAWLRREAFGFVFQGYHLIPTESARENVEVPAIYSGIDETARSERASALLTRLGMAEKMGNRPNQLSGGQQQRVSIARALMNGGNIVLADEPTGALDSKSGAEVMVLLRELADAGHTVILITHDRDVAEQARRVIEIKDGNIIADSGTTVPPASVNKFASINMHDAEKDQGTPLLTGLHEALRTAWRGMKINRSRTILTLLGIVIGVVSVIVMLAIGEGAKQQVVAQMGAMGPNMMYVGSRVPDNGGPVGVITLDDFEAILTLPEVVRVMPVLRDPALARYGNESMQLEVLGVSESLPKVHRWALSQGRFFNAKENAQIAPVVVLGADVYDKLFPDGKNPLGRQILLNGAPFEIIGVMQRKGADSGNNKPDEQIFVPHQTGMVRVFPQLRDESYGVIEAASSDLVLQTQTKIEELMYKRHGRMDFRVYNSAARMQAEAETRNTMTLMLSLIAAVSLLVGGIGVMNVMLMTVRERTKEIGIRMATGARQKDILRQFLTEAMLVTVSGGLVGVVLGLLIGTVLIFINVPVVFSVTAIAGAFGCAVATGVIFGYMPAKSAAQLDPVVALVGE
jgi:macrolide transport system ATP-binding/permease protein